MEDDVKTQVVRRFTNDLEGETALEVQTQRAQRAADVLDNMKRRERLEMLYKDPDGTSRYDPQN